MLERGITMAEIEQVALSGDEIEGYPDDTPFPSRLLLGFPQGRPVHVVLAEEPDSDVTHVITAYVPDPSMWDEAFRRRRT
jgi:hypothetical protein